MREELLQQITPTLQRIAREVTEAAGQQWRVEYDDCLQEARIGAWQGLYDGEQKGLQGADLARYGIAAGRNAVKRSIARLRRDGIYYAQNAGLIGPRGM